MLLAAPKRIGMKPLAGLTHVLDQLNITGVDRVELRIERNVYAPMKEAAPAADPTHQSLSPSANRLYPAPAVSRLNAPLEAST